MSDKEETMTAVATDATDHAVDFEDDVEDFLPARRKRVGPLTVALLVLLVAVLGVFGGVQLQKLRGKTTTVAATFAGGRAAGSTFGTVKLVDGDTIYVTASDGSIVKVKTTAGATTISRSVTGTAADLQPGQTVVVQGAAGPDGTVAATRVTEGGQGGQGGQGGARGGGGGGG